MEAEVRKRLRDLGKAHQFERAAMTANFKAHMNNLNRLVATGQVSPERAEDEFLVNVGMVFDAREALKKSPKDKWIKFLRGMIDFHNKYFLEHISKTNKVSCKKGCSGCCKIFVSTGAEEAADIAQDIKLGKITIDEKELEAHAKIEEKNWVFKNCIFLGSKGECRIYDKRPLSCRNYYVTSDPKECDPSVNPDGKVDVVNMLMGEIMTSAYYNETEKIESLPRAVFRALKGGE